ncbi:MAG: hypothetical protein ACOCSC_01095 [Candidatus Hadarchaeota archaeon]
MDTMVIVGLVLGFLLGISGIAFVFDAASEAISSAQDLLTQFSTLSTIALIVVALILIVAVKMVSSLIIGIVIGAVLNIILEVNGFSIMDEVGSAVMSMFTIPLRIITL